MSMMLPAVRGVQEDRSAQAAEKRAAEALLDAANEPPEDFEQPENEGTEIEIDASLTISTEEKLKTLDFEQMSVSEMAEAKRMLARMQLPVDPIASRRTKASHLGHRVDAARHVAAIYATRRRVA